MKENFVSHSSQLHKWTFLASAAQIIFKKSFASLFLSHPIIFVQREIAAFEALLKKKRYLLEAPFLSGLNEKQTSSLKVTGLR